MYRHGHFFFVICTGYGIPTASVITVGRYTNRGVMRDKIFTFYYFSFGGA